MLVWTYVPNSRLIRKLPDMNGSGEKRYRIESYLNFITFHQEIPGKKTGHPFFTVVVFTVVVVVVFVGMP